MRVLITGAEGFTGRYMAAELKSLGHEVHGLVRHPCALSCCDQVYTADLNDAKALRVAVEAVQPQWVVHLAAVSFVPHGDVEDIYRTNLIGTRKLLQALADWSQRPEAVLLASSANVYGNAGVERIDEHVSLHPANDYAVSKLAMEYLAHMYGQRVPSIVARPFNYTGVGQSLSFLLPKMVDHFRRRAPFIELGNLDVARDFLDVRTVVGYYRRLLQTPAAVGGTFNISSGETWALGDLLQMARELSGHDIQVRINPVFVRDDEIKTLCGSPARLHALVGHLPGIELRDTLRWMLDAP